MSKKTRILLYDSGDYGCCGPIFSVDEYIWWQASEFRKKSTVYLKERKNNINLDYICTNCIFNGQMMLSAKVKKIEVFKYLQNGEYKFIKNCKSTKEIKEMGYDFFVYLEEVEEYYYNNKRDNIDFRANPYLNQKKVKPLFNTLNIIGDTTGLGLTIAKTFRENHFCVNLFDKTFKKLNEAKENLRYIKSYSNYDSYKIEALENYLISEKLRNSFVIVISNNDNYEKKYKELVDKYCDIFCNLCLCHIRIKNGEYNIVLNTNLAPKNKKEAKKLVNKLDLTDEKKNKVIENWQLLKSKYIYTLEIKKEKDVIKFLQNKILNKEIDYNKIIFWSSVFLYFVIKIIRIIIRY